MKKVLTLFLVSTLSSISFGQINKSIWDSLRTIETDYYQLKIPYNWREIPPREGRQTELMFEGSGLVFPSSFNGYPVILTIFMVKQEASDLEDCKNKCLRAYRANQDREFPADFNDGELKIKLQSGQEAYILNTHFFRKTKGLNQSRFDLILYSNKAQCGYMYTISVQYADKQYKFESDNNLSEFAKQLYSYVLLK